jgi:hypothetical protein
VGGWWVNPSNHVLEPAKNAPVEIRRPNSLGNSSYSLGSKRNWRRARNWPSSERGASLYIRLQIAESEERNRAWRRVVKNHARGIF